MVYLLATGHDGASQAELPKDLKGVAESLLSTFGYKDLRLLDAVLLRAREGRDAFAKGSITNLPAGSTQSASYELMYQSARLEPNDGKNLVALYNFHFNLKVPAAPPAQPPWQEVGLNTDVSIPEGQLVVAGKSRIGTGDTALILVIGAKVVD
jgi:hypothetical protein